MRNQLRVLRARCRVAIHNRAHRGIRHPRRRTDHAFHNLVALDAPICVQLHQAAQHQPVLARPQAANVGRKLLRQHGNCAVGKVDARTAQPRLQVKIGPFAHVLGHIGNVHLQRKAAAGALFHQHRVVKVLCRLAVDGHNGQSAKIAPLCYLCRIEMGYRTRFGQHVFREDTRQLVLADHHLHINAEIVRGAQHLHHTSLRRLIWRGPRGNLHIDNQTFEIVMLRPRSGLFAQRAMRCKCLRLPH